MSHEDIERELLEGEYGFIDLDSMSPPEILESATLPEDCINLFDPLQVDYWKEDGNFQRVLSYMEERRLGSAKNRPDAYYFSSKDRVHGNRLIIPFKDFDGDIIFYQSRKIFDWDNRPKYTSKQNGSRSLFGVDKIDTSVDEIFVFEGPIDATFTRNGIAVGGISENGEAMFTDIQKEQWNQLFPYKKIWVLDSQWIDRTSYQKTEILLKKGEKVFLWPKHFGEKHKDFNALCLEKGIDQISGKFILDNSYSGLEGEIKFKLI